jgi:hypothetical protein
MYPTRKKKTSRACIERNVSIRNETNPPTIFTAFLLKDTSYNRWLAWGIIALFIKELLGVGILNSRIGQGYSSILHDTPANSGIRSGYCLRVPMFYFQGVS